MTDPTHSAPGERGNDEFSFDLGSLLLRGARESSSGIAVMSPERAPLGYGELLDANRSLGRALRTVGVGRQDRVVVSMPNGPDLATALLGSATAAVCVPLNPAYTETEADSMLASVAPGAVVVHAAHPNPASETAESRGIPVLRLEPLAASGTWTINAPDAVVDVSKDGLDPASSDIALMLHTSGTTSAPKQVPLSHGNLTYAAQQVVRSLRLDPSDICLNVMPLFHSHGFAGALLSTLASGGAVCCTPGFDPRYFLAWAEQVGATWYTAAPTIHHAVAALPGDWSGFRFIRSASAPLPPPIASELERRFNAPLIEVYGMTEAYQIAANPLPPGERRLGTVGLPTGTEIAVLDDSGARCEDGTTGEIVVRGPNVFGGYSSPSGANDGAFTSGFFRTGDLGRIDDGYLSVVGRVKEIINRGGEKISPREVDEAMLRHPAVDDAVTFSVKDPSLGEDIGAAVMLHPGHELTKPELRRYLSHTLAPFKVPNHVVFVDELPLGSTGKRQRMGLADQLGVTSTTNRGAAEEQVVEGSTADVVRHLWQQVIGLDAPPSGEDRFFDIGGSSLAAMELVSGIEDRLGVQLPLDDLLEMDTLSSMIDHVEKLRSGDGAAEAKHIRVMRAGPGPVTVVLVPGAWGSAIGLNGIASALHPDRHVVGFQYPGHAPGERAHDSITDLARMLGAELESAGIGPPLALYGNSLGSWVVYEAALHLNRAGAPPTALVLGDMFSPVLRDSALVMRRPPLRRAASAIRSRIARSPLGPRGPRAAPLSAGAERRRNDVFAASKVAQDRYRPGPYEGDATLMRAAERRTRFSNDSYGWDSLITGEISTVDVSGGHHNMHTVHATDIARAIDQTIDGALGERS